jgi:hypothetical protein
MIFNRGEAKASAAQPNGPYVSQKVWGLVRSARQATKEATASAAGTKGSSSGLGSMGVLDGGGACISVLVVKIGYTAQIVQMCSAHATPARSTSIRRSPEVKKQKGQKRRMIVDALPLFDCTCVDHIPLPRLIVVTALCDARWIHGDVTGEADH